MIAGSSGHRRRSRRLSAPFSGRRRQRRRSWASTAEGIEILQNSSTTEARSTAPSARSLFWRGWVRSLRRWLSIGLPVMGMVVVLIAIVSVVDRQMQLVFVVAGVLLIEAGVWKLANPILPSERRYTELRGEVDHFVDLVREMNAAAVEARQSDSGRPVGRLPRFALHPPRIGRPDGPAGREGGGGTRDGASAPRRRGIRSRVRGGVQPPRRTPHRLSGVPRDRRSPTADASLPPTLPLRPMLDSRDTTKMRRRAARRPGGPPSPAPGRARRAVAPPPRECLEGLPTAGGR